MRAHHQDGFMLALERLGVKEKGEQRGLPSDEGILINRVVSHAWCVVTAGGLRVARRSDIDTMVAMG